MFSQMLNRRCSIGSSAEVLATPTSTSRNCFPSDTRIRPRPHRVRPGSTPRIRTLQVCHDGGLRGRSTPVIKGLRLFSSEGFHHFISSVVVSVNVLHIIRIFESIEQLQDAPSAVFI